MAPYTRKTSKTNYCKSSEGRKREGHRGAADRGLADGSRHQEAVAQTPEGRLRAWVESNYTHVPLREKDTGTKLEALFGAYTSASPPVHQKPLGRNKLAAMLSAVYVGIGPHKNSSSTVNGLFLLR